ncbi:MAG: AAA family ATPase [Gallionella sp.]|nr:AAA family ATPase [Gallionella sp.]
MVNETERAADALNHIDAGCARDEWVRAGMAAKSAGLDFDDFNNWSASAGNYAGENECRTVWKSFGDSGAVTPATLYGMAFAQGWKDPSKSRAKGTRPNPPLTRTKQTPQTPVKQAASANAVQVWERCIPATPAEAYIHRKQGEPDGLRVYPASASPLVIHDKDMKPHNVTGWLVVPCWSGNDLQTLQFISPEKGIQKLNLPKGKFNDGFFTVGDVTDCAYIAEGIGQAWAINQATGKAAVVTFGSVRMATVAKALRDKFPAARLVIVPDKGMEDKAAKIAADVSGQWIAMPADKPGNYDANDYAIEFGTGALSDLLEHPIEPPIEYPLSVAFADELTGEFTPPDEIVEGVLTAGDGSILYGDSNSGKTFFVIDMACAVARGVPWMGKQTEPGLVIYLAAESPASVRSRIQAYQRHHGVRVPNFAIVQSPIDLFDGDADTDKLIQLVKQIEWQKGQPARLIIGDTLARLSAGANENAGQDMGLVVRRFDRIRAECKAHFLLIHHSGKNAAAGARGWSGVRAAVDTEIEVTDSPAGRCCEITKQRDLSTKGDRIGFKLHVVTLGLTKWKSPATSCVVMPADAPDKQSGKRISEVGGAIVEMLRTKGTGVKKKDVVAHFAERYVSSAVYRELKKLVEGGQVKELMGVVSAEVSEVRNGAN